MSPDTVALWIKKMFRKVVGVSDKERGHEGNEGTQPIVRLLPDVGMGIGRTHTKLL